MDGRTVLFTAGFGWYSRPDGRGGTMPRMGHVFARLNGYGLQLIPYWPYRFLRPAEDDPKVVRVVRRTPEGDRTARVAVDNPRSVNGVVDVATEPSPQGWRIETSVFSVPWPDGFDVASPTDESDRVSFYLEGADDATIFPQGPVLNERLPAPEALAGQGQTIVNREVVDDIQVVELAYEYDGEPWWQSHWMIPWTPERTLVFTAQAPAHAAELTRRAVQEMACGSLPMSGSAGTARPSGAG
jgi:hypothetical protein